MLKKYKEHPIGEFSSWLLFNDFSQLLSYWQYNFICLQVLDCINYKFDFIYANQLRWISLDKSTLILEGQVNHCGSQLFSMVYIICLKNPKILIGGQNIVQDLSLLHKILKMNIYTSTIILHRRILYPLNNVCSILLGYTIEWYSPITKVVWLSYSILEVIHQPILGPPYIYW